MGLKLLLQQTDHHPHGQSYPLPPPLPQMIHFIITLFWRRGCVFQFSKSLKGCFSPPTPSAANEVSRGGAVTLFSKVTCEVNGEAKARAVWLLSHFQATAGANLHRSLRRGSQGVQATS